MIRALWSMVVAMLWFRQRTAHSRSAKSFKAWDKFCDASLPLKPNPKDAVELHVKHYVQQAKADDLSATAGKDKGRFARRHKTYTRARDFMPRWAWAYVPYAEVVAAGIGVGYLAKEKPEVLSYGLTAAVGAAAKLWTLAASAQATVANASWDAIAASTIAGFGVVGMGLTVHAIRKRRLAAA